MVQERRKFIRIPETGELSYRVIPDVKTKRFISRDISRGGVRFYVHEFVPKGSILKISFKLPNNSLFFESLVRVQWVVMHTASNYYEIGAEFVDIPFAAVKNILEFIALKIVGENT